LTVYVPIETYTCENPVVLAVFVLVTPSPQTIVAVTEAPVEENSGILTVLFAASVVKVKIAADIIYNIYSLNYNIYVKWYVQ
jgi:hypothetical protein